MAEERRGLNVLFWGTPDFGIPTLEAIRQSDHRIVGVVTNPDRPAGRGRRLKPGPVKEWAVEAGVPVLQPEKPRGDEFVAAVRALDPDVSVVAAYGQILREEILELPRLGSINVHGSILPELRGAAPVNRAIMLGHDRSGVSIMRMVLALDAGPVFRTVTCPIGPETTAGELYETLSRLGGDAVVAVLDDMAAGRAVETPQDDEAATYAPKMDRDVARIDWAAPASVVSRHIRGCDPWPGAWTTLGGDPIQCFRPRVVSDDGGSSEAGLTGGSGPGASDGDPGAIVARGSGDGLTVVTGDGLIEIGEVRPAGKRRMSAADWFRGLRDATNARFD